MVAFWEILEEISGESLLGNFGGILEKFLKQSMEYVLKEHSKDIRRKRSGRNSKKIHEAISEDGFWRGMFYFTLSHLLEAASGVGFFFIDDWIIEMKMIAWTWSGVEGYQQCQLIYI